MTEPARRTRRKRPHVAAGARVVAAGAATAGTLVMVGLMARPAEEAPGQMETTASPASEVTAAPTPVAPPARIVVVRRHHPAPAGTVASSAPVIDRRSAPAAVAPAPAPAPAPRRAAPATTSRGS